MTAIEAFFFGLLQGLTEFLPVSSSAHLKLAKIFFGIQSSEKDVFFDLLCHLGTLFALLFIFRQEIQSILFCNRRKLLHLFAATIPLIPFYFLLKPLRQFASDPHFLGICLLITALILWIGDKIRFSKSPVSSKKKEWSDLLWIGTSQSFALIPGISRSGSTISCAKILGWTPKEAVSFSFLLSIPTIIGGNLLELVKLKDTSLPTLPSLSCCLIGFSTAFFFGLLIGSIAIPFLEKGNLRPFAWYCAAIGLFATLYLNFNFLENL